ncbi:glycosyltransferase family 39 protein [Hymenobacter sp. RP-2-7]|uniref:Glycosyltransferase family 39 protein n=1 Tax=Hymenobacter polaris TaxID=2682546 RepID=A0A7Y0FLK9_9BACT|nr:glycosyltransferase family 39 protein [Hymenobacter polaris]NML64917.1 glycosyltransferase family 39 protein [Hymenobacter polaris]
MRRHLPLLFALVKFISGLLLAGYGRYELHRDEYLYLDYGRHLAWGYLEVPPLTALQSWVSLGLGGGFFWVKLWPLLWGAGTVYVVVLLARRLGGGTWAQALAGVCYLCAAYGRLNLLFQPNSFEVLSFTLATYLLVRYQQPDGRPRHLYWLGVVLGLGVLNKFTTFFFGAAVVGALLVAAPRTLRQGAFWRAAALGLLVASPTLLWQVAHGLPFRHHMALLHSSQLVHVSAADFWRDQLLQCAAALLVWVPGLGAALLGRPQPAARVVGLVYAGGLLILTLLHGKSYYALGYYPALFAVGAVWWQAQLAGGSWAARLGQVALLVLPVLLNVRVAPIIYPVLPPARMAALGQQPFYQKIGVFRGNDGRTRPLPQDYADMLGWQELGDKVYRAYQALPAATRANTLIKCDNYGQAGAINYYNRGRHLPAATSFNGSYLYWFPPVQPWPQMLLVGEGNPAHLVPYFRELRQVGEITNPYALGKGTTIYLALGPTPALLALVRAERAQELAAWEGGR